MTNKSEEQMLANSLELVGHRLNRFLNNSDKSIVKNTLEDIQKTLNEYYKGNYTYWEY